MAAKVTRIYYTLTSKGRAWLADEAPPPAKYSKALAALAELISDNDVPYTAEQVGALIGIPQAQAPEALSHLAQAGYVKTTTPPKLTSSGGVAKIRIRSIEDLAAAEARADEARKRYARSVKGRAAHYKYEKEKGKPKNVRYWSDPNKGRLVQKRYRLRRRIQELSEFLEKHPDQKAVIQPLIDQAVQKLNQLGG